ncbi:hypothetical protein [Methylobacterium oryzisoli]|uniref:hypothetical protein n=1 Tax=Methylobacterium oryzisoli TaxID=3385502 RepID=UPI003891CE11
MAAAELVDAAPRRARVRPAPDWPKPLVAAVKAVGGLAALAGAAFGPPTYQCRQMQEAGQFYYGDTLRACVRARVAERYATAEVFLARTLAPR